MGAPDFFSPFRYAFVVTARHCLGDHFEGRIEKSVHLKVGFSVEPLTSGIPPMSVIYPQSISYAVYSGPGLDVAILIVNASEMAVSVWDGWRSIYWGSICASGSGEWAFRIDGRGAST